MLVFDSTTVIELIVIRGGLKFFSHCNTAELCGKTIVLMKTSLNKKKETDGLVWYLCEG